MSLAYEDKQKAYFLAYNAARNFGTHEQGHRWGCYARDSLEIANALNKGYSIGKKFLRSAAIFFSEENIDKVLEREGIEHNNPVPPTLSHGPQVSTMEDGDDKDDEDIKRKLKEKNE